MKIVIVGKDDSFRLSFVKYVQKNLNHVVINEVSEASLLFNLELNDIDIVILDISKDRLGSFKVAKEFFWTQPHISIIAISDKKPTKETLFKLIEIGIKGFMKKENVFNELNRAINHVVTDRYYYPLEILFPISKKKR